jgi:hypothetical protein
VGDLVFLSTENLSLPKGRARKLTPKYLGPYKVLKADHSSSTYKIKLPPDLKAQQIHNTFHEKVLKHHVKNDLKLFPKCETRVHYHIREDVTLPHGFQSDPTGIFRIYWNPVDSFGRECHSNPECRTPPHFPVGYRFF